jgi:hypothetical protein
MGMASGFLQPEVEGRREVQAGDSQNLEKTVHLEGGTKTWAVCSRVERLSKRRTGVVTGSGVSIKFYAEIGRNH